MMGKKDTNQRNEAEKVLRRKKKHHILIQVFKNDTRKHREKEEEKVQPDLRKQKALIIL